jgi:hypothetical protein
MTKKIFITAALLIGVITIYSCTQEDSETNNKMLMARGSNEFNEFDSLLKELYKGADSVETAKVYYNDSTSYKIARVYELQSDKSLKIRGYLFKDIKYNTEAHYVSDDNGNLTHYFYDENKKLESKSYKVESNETYINSGITLAMDKTWFGWGPKVEGPCIGNLRYWHRCYFICGLLVDDEWVTDAHGFLYTTPCEGDPHMSSGVNS